MNSLLMMDEIHYDFSSHCEKAVVKTSRLIRILHESSVGCSCDRFLVEFHDDLFLFVYCRGFVVLDYISAYPTLLYYSADCLQHNRRWLSELWVIQHGNYLNS